MRQIAIHTPLGSFETNFSVANGDTELSAEQFLNHIYNKLGGTKTGGLYIKVKTTAGTVILPGALVANSAFILSD